jgi:hypothetical protein
MKDFTAGESRPRDRGVLATVWVWVGLVALAGSVRAAEVQLAPAEPLRWKFKAGESIRYSMVQEISQETRDPGRALKLTMNQTVDLHWSVKSVADDGVADMTWTIDRVRAKVSGPEGGFEFDSQTGKDPEGPLGAQVGPLVKPLVGAEFSLKMNGRGEYRDVKVPPKVVESLRQAGPGASAGVVDPEEGLKNMINQANLILPETALKPGTTWSKQSRSAMPMLGTMVWDRLFTFEGPDPTATELRRISMETKVSLEPAADSNVVVKITSPPSKGEFVFDPQAGRIVSSRVNENLQMSFAVQGQTSEHTSNRVTTMTLVRDGGTK